MGLMTKGEEEMLLNLKQIKNGLNNAIETIESGQKLADIKFIQQGFATANIMLYEGVSTKQIKKLLKSENYR